MVNIVHQYKWFLTQSCQNLPMSHFEFLLNWCGHTRHLFSLKCQNSPFLALNPICTRGADSALPPEVFLKSSKTPQDNEMTFRYFSFTPLRRILYTLTMLSVLRCCHGNLLFPGCHIIFGMEK